jgi:hypothetical protein
LGIEGLAGGFVFHFLEARGAAYWTLTLVSGALLSALDSWPGASWPRQPKGQVVLLKLALLALAHHYPDGRQTIFVLNILLSAFFAHELDLVRSFAWGRPVRPCKTAVTSAHSP